MRSSMGWMKSGSTRWDGHPSSLLIVPRHDALAEGLCVQVMKNPSLGLSSIEIATFPADGHEGGNLISCLCRRGNSSECRPVTTPLWSLILLPPLTLSLERLSGVLYTEGCNSGVGLCYGQRSVCRLKPCVVGLGGCLPLSDVLQTLVSSGPSSFLLVNFWVVIYLLGCLLCCRAGKGVVMNACGRV